MRTWIEQNDQRYVVKSMEGARLTLLGGNGPQTGEAVVCRKGKHGEWRKPVVIVDRMGRELTLAQPM